MENDQTDPIRNEINTLLSQVFLKDKTNNFKIIRKGEQIPLILSFLHSKDNKISAKYELLKTLYNSFTSIPYNLEIFRRYKIENTQMDIFIILVSIYISSEHNNDENEKNIFENFQKIILIVLNLFISSVTCPIEVYEYMNSYIKQYINKESEKELPLTKEKFSRYLKILKVLYGIDSKEQTPQNYFYFSGEGEIKIPNKRNIFNIDRGINVSLWFKLSDKSSLFTITNSRLFHLDFASGEVLFFKIDTENHLTSSLTNEKTICDLNTNQWFQVLIKLSYDYRAKLNIDLFINGAKCNFKCESEISRSDIKSISLFKNFIGICSSILITKGKNSDSFPLEIKDANENLQFPYGIYSEEIYSQFARVDLELPGKRKKENIIIKDTFSHLFMNYQTNNFTEEVVDQWMSLYMPTRIEKDESNNNLVILKDAVSELDAEFESQIENVNGVHVFTPKYNYIYLIGGVNNFLPIAEMITSLNKYEGYIESDVLTQDNFNDFIWIIVTVLSGQNYFNVLNAESGHFFSCLSIFLEKISSERYNKEVIGLFKTISSSLINDDNYSNLCQVFHREIMLNENILFKFSFELLEEVWKHIYTIYLSKQLIDVIDISKMCSILLRYDKEHDTKFCCEEHTKFFIHSETFEVLKPDLKTRLAPLQNIIRLIMKKNESENENPLTLYQLLTMEISPCLQLLIIDSFVEYYSNYPKNKRTGNKMFLNENIKELIKINLFVLSTALYDVRASIVNFIFILISLDNYDNSKAFLTPSQQVFIENNFIPTNVFIEKEKSQESDSSTSQSTDSSKGQEDVSNSSISSKQDLHCDGIHYVRIFVPPNKENLSKYYSTSYFMIINFRMLGFLTDWINRGIMLSMAINLLVKLSIHSEIPVTITFLSLVEDKIKEESTKVSLSTDFKKNSVLLEVVQNKLFFGWILDLTLQAYLYNQIPNYTPGFSLDKVSENEDSRIIISENLLSKGKYIITKICRENKYKLDYLLTWGTYYKILFEKNRDMYSLVRIFIKDILQEVIKRVDDQLKQHIADIDDFYWRSYIYLFPIAFEFETFYISFNSLEGNVDDNKKSLTIPSFFSPSFFIEEDKKLSDDEKFEMLRKLINPGKDLWERKLIKKTLEDNVSYYVSNTSEEHQNIFSCELELLTFVEGLKESKLNNKGIPLMKMISNSFSLLISVLETKERVIEMIEEYEKFIIFLIIASSNLKNSDKEKYKYIQDVTKNVIYFGTCFLINEASEKPLLSGTIIKSLKNIFKISFKIYNNIKSHIQKQNSRGTMKKIFSFSSSTVDLTGCALYLLFKRCFDNNDFDGISMDPLVGSGSNILSKKEQDQLYGSEKDMKAIFSNQKFKDCYTENAKLKKEVETDLFRFKDIVESRKKTVTGIIPYYDHEMTNKMNSINYEPGSIDITLNSNFIQESKYQDELKNDIFLSNQKFSLQLEVYNIEKEFLYYKRLKSYKIHKKRLFSFRGLWSNQDLFYNDGLLKKKLINHFSQEFSRILLTPILDMNSYLPQFTEFDPKDLFYSENEQSKKIKIAVDLDLEGKFNNGNISNDSSIIQKEDEKYNILHKIYKEYFTYTDSTANKIKKISPNEKFIQFIHKGMIYNKTGYESIVECCLIKQSCHVKGYFFNDNNKIGFYAYDIKNDNNLEEYDPDRNTCFGSIFKAQVEKMKHYYITIAYKEIEMILKRRYFFRRNALEFFTIKKKSYYFKFKNQNECQKILESMKQHIKYETIYIDYSKIDKKEGIYNKEPSLKYPNNKCPHLSLSDKYKKWTEWEISTLEMLMYLNIYGNRSYSDLMQYPVSPWPFQDYNSPIFSIEKEKIRDFNIPMGMTTITKESENRKTAYLAHFDSMREENEENAYCFGSHYSNSLYTTHYLVRVFPFSYIKIELQGKTFDDPNRLFNDMEKSFICAITQKCDVRELIPEFFFFPEMFYNSNSLNLGEIRVSDNIIRVNDVLMPKWTENNGYTFIRNFRKVLESEEVSEGIHKWFDLIFGKNQRDKTNLFYAESYETFEEEVFNKADQEQKAYSLRMLEFGVTPHQIFSSWSGASERKKYEMLGKNPQISQPNNLVLETAKIDIDNKPIYIRMVENSSKKIIITISCHEVVYYTLAKKSGSKQNPEINQFDLEYIRKVSVMQPRHRMKNSPKKPPMKMFCEGNYLSVGGFWNGQIMVMSLKEKTTETTMVYQKELMSPVVVIVIDKSDNFAICGTLQGAVFVYKIDAKDPTSWKEHKDLYDHRDEITDIAINDKQNIFVTCSKDGYAMIYTIPRCKLINSLKLNSLSPPSLCLVSSSPLPCIVFYFKKEKKIEVYSINGHFIISRNLDSEITEWKLFTNYLFEDFIMLTSYNNRISILNLPDLKEVVSKSGTEHKIEDFEVSEDRSFAMILE